MIEIHKQSNGKYTITRWSAAFKAEVLTRAENLSEATLLDFLSTGTGDKWELLEKLDEGILTMNDAGEEVLDANQTTH